MPSSRASDGRMPYITDCPAPMQVRLMNRMRKARRRSACVVALATNSSATASALAVCVGRSSLASSSAADMMLSDVAPKPLQGRARVKRSLRFLEADLGAVAAAFGVDHGHLREAFASGREKHRL